MSVDPQGRYEHDPEKLKKRGFRKYKKTEKQIQEEFDKKVKEMDRFLPRHPGKCRRCFSTNLRRIALDLPLLCERCGFIDVYRL